MNALSCTLKRSRKSVLFLTLLLISSCGGGQISVDDDKVKQVLECTGDCNRYPVFEYQLEDLDNLTPTFKRQLLEYELIHEIDCPHLYEWLKEEQNGDR